MSLINPSNTEPQLKTTNDNQSQGNNINSNSVGSTNANTSANQSDQTLNQADFFSLLTQQLTMQDPFKPVDNDQMIAQMASFSTVSGIDNLNKEIVNLNAVMTSNQALQASSLIGQKVLIPSPQANMSAEESQIKAMVSISEPTNEVNVRVENDKGEFITNFAIDGTDIGNKEFQWNGRNANDEQVPTGKYQFKVTGQYDGNSHELPVSTYAHVTSVSLGSAQNGSILNLRGMGGINLADILAISEN